MWYWSTLAVILTIGSVEGEFNYTKCPNYWEVRSEVVATSFSLDLMSGQFYEIFYHDYFQGACPHRRCPQTVKSYNLSVGEYGQIIDNFTVRCNYPGHDYHTPFYDNITEHRGFVYMSWPQVGWVFPDTFATVSNNTVDIGYGKQYEWLVEFQCMDEVDEKNGDSRVYYLGINAYAYLPNPSDSFKNEMLNAMKAVGLEPYMNVTDWHVTNQTNCTYPW